MKTTCSFLFVVSIAFRAFAQEPTSQPTNLVFQNFTLTTFSGSFTPAAGNPDGYVALFSASIPDTDPVDGTEYAYNESLGNAYVVVNSNSTSFNIVDVNPNKTYYFKVFSFNGSGAAIDYLQNSPLYGEAYALPSPILESNQTPVDVDEDQDLAISVNFTDAGFGVGSIFVDYGPLEEVDNIYDIAEDGVDDNSDVESLQLTNTSGSTYEGTIPFSEFGDLGLIYIFRAYDNQSNVYVTTDPYIVVIFKDQGVSIPYTSFGSNLSNYEIISIPLDLDLENVNIVLGDDLGPYGDKKSWRLFQYSAGQTEELNGNSTLSAGKGYWLIAKNQTVIDTGPGSTVRPFVEDLETGWNLIGNPYPFDLDWDDVKDWSSAGLGDLRVFENGSFTTRGELKAFEGGFVMATAGVQLVIPVNKNPSVNRVHRSEVNRNPLGSDHWEILFKIKNGERQYNLGGIGMHTEASEGADQFDDFTLPRFIEFVEINHNKKFHNIPFSKDIIPVEENHEWSFEVEANAESELIELSWDNSYFGVNKEIYLWDVSQQRPINMRSQNNYSFNKTLSKPFKVFYGSASFVNERIVPEKLVVQHPYPNPSANTITFAFSTPAGISDATLDIYTLQGQKINTMRVASTTPGYHELIWNGLDLHGNRPVHGAYVSVLKLGEKVFSQRLILK
ncbi:MAG: hypothetical protein L0Y35_06880 [Flammeovirgaceae bacterium]|nr:hypothetical protein [Flammeovirgaceae bacterium]